MNAKRRKTRKKTTIKRKIKKTKVIKDSEYKKIKKGSLLMLKQGNAIRVRKKIGNRLEIDVQSPKGWKKWHSTISKNAIDYIIME